MTKARVAVTNEIVLSRVTAETYDRFARFLRGRGWDSLDSLLNAGLEGENVLDAGSGPGYIGLEWLKRRSGKGRLVGLDISPEMIALARRNAREYGLEDRTEYVQGDAMDMPFPDGCFDAVLSNGSLHEWEDPAGLRRDPAGSEAGREFLGLRRQARREPADQMAHLRDHKAEGDPPRL